MMSSCSQSDSSRSQSSRQARMEAVLSEAFAPLRLEIRDTSKRHSKHAAMRAAASQAVRGPAQVGETHYEVRLVSARFDGMAPLARHRLVHEVLAPEFASGLHALTLTLHGSAHAPGELPDAPKGPAGA